MKTLLNLIQLSIIILIFCVATFFSIKLIINRYASCCTVHDFAESTIIAVALVMMLYLVAITIKHVFTEENN